MANPMETAASKLSSRKPLPLLNEDSVRLFLMPAPLPWWKQPLVRIGVLVIGGIFLTYVGINAEAYLRISDAATKNAQAKAESNAITIPTPLPTEPVPQVGQPAAIPTVAPTPTPLPPQIPENTLSYPDLSISVPVHWDVPLNGTDKPLQTGIVHIEGTAKPGQAGTVAIAGHSSYFPWGKGSYKTIFAPLVRAKEGSIIEINYQNKAYRYKVVRKWEVAPTDMSVLKSSTDSVLRLITCTPVGTNLRRLIVEAIQIEPNPSLNSQFSSSEITGQLPNDR